MSVILIFAHLTKIVFSEWNAYNFFLVSEFHGKWKSFECRICDNQDLFYPFRAKLVKTNVIVYLRWNLASRLTQICWIDGDISSFFSDPKIPFEGKFGPKEKIVSFRWNLVPGLIRICSSRWSGLLFLYWTEIPFLCKFSPKIDNCL